MSEWHAKVGMNMLASKLGNLLQAARPRQWIKNLLVFAAIVFAQKLGDIVAVSMVFGAFLVFCVLSSGVYLINDVVDLEQDKRHPLKSQRPVAAGRISKCEALVWAIGFLTVAITAGLRLNLCFGLVCVGYVTLQMAYMLWLKHAVILDVLAIAVGFVLRAVGGAVVIEIEFSHWLMVCTLFLALFLVVCKRRHELLLLGDNSGWHRKALANYSQAMLDQMVAVTTSSTIIAYTLYTVSPQTVAKFGGDQLKYTVPFVLYGIFRYLFLVYRREEGGSPEGLLLSDRALLISIVLYALTAAALVYGGKML